jgi:hypothetical protein
MPSGGQCAEDFAKNIMARFVFRLIALLSIPLLVILLIRSQPYEDRALHQLIIPPGCAAPCFLGIRPGVTTVTDMVGLLEASGWVNRADITVTTRFNVVRLEWTWNGQQPTMLEGSSQAVATILAGFNDEKALGEPERVITGLSIRTSIPYGDLHLLLGRALNKPNYIVSNGLINPRVTAVYSEYGLVALSALMDCPVSLGTFWHTSVILHIGYTFIEDILHVCRGIL